MVPKYGEPNAGIRTGVGLKLTTLQWNVGQKWLDGILTGQVTMTTHRFGKLFAANFLGSFGFCIASLQKEPLMQIVAATSGR